MSELSFILRHPAGELFVDASTHNRIGPGNTFPKGVVNNNGTATFSQLGR